MEQVYTSLGTQGLLNIFITLGSIVLTWFALKIVRFELFVRDIKSGQSKLLQIILAVVIGHQLGKFFIDYSNWSSLLRGLF